MEERDNKNGLRWVDFREEPFTLYGVNDKFERLPLEVAKATSEGVTNLYNQASGGRIRFSTNSRKMCIRATIASSPSLTFRRSFAITARRIISPCSSAAS